MGYFQRNGAGHKLKFSDSFRNFVIIFLSANTVPISCADLKNLSPRETFKLFPQFHFKFIYADPELVPGRINHPISTASGMDILFSNFNAGPFGMLEWEATIQWRSQSKVSHFAQCFVHVYMEDELTDRGILYKKLVIAMAMQQRMLEFPITLFSLESFGVMTKFQPNLSLDFTVTTYSCYLPRA